MSQLTEMDKEIESIGGCKLLLNVDHQGTKLIDWAEQNRDNIESWLSTHGALLLRGLNITSSKQFGKFMSTVFGSELLNYEHRSTPRTELKGNVYTATEYHANQLIVQHNEQAYTNSWPLRIGFYCMLPSVAGGQTPIADSREVFKRVPEEIKAKFREKGILYVRNFSQIDLPWTEVYGTDDPKVVEAYCEANNIQFQWQADGALRTQQHLPAIHTHPDTHEELWFNQAHLFHSSTLGDELHDALVNSVGKDNLPRNTFYGDGSEIESDVIQTLLSIYQKCKIKFDWQKGDVMLLDNMLFSHGREPFEGERRVLTGMARGYTLV